MGPSRPAGFWPSYGQNHPHPVGGRLPQLLPHGGHRHSGRDGSVHGSLRCGLGSWSRASRLPRAHAALPAPALDDTAETNVLREPVLRDEAFTFQVRGVAATRADRRRGHLRVASPHRGSRHSPASTAEASTRGASPSRRRSRCRRALSSRSGSGCGSRRPAPGHGRRHGDVSSTEREEPLGRSAGGPGRPRRQRRRRRAGAA